MKKKKVYICPIVEKVYINGLNLMASNSSPWVDAKVHHSDHDSDNGAWRVGYDSEWPTATSPWDKELSK